MQKKLIALAIAGLASSAAFAQTNVTIYGVFDIGYINAKSDQSDTAAINTSDAKFSGLGSGNLSGPRLGFRAEEDLGGGWKAGGLWEFGTMALDGGAVAGAGAANGINTTRQSYLFLSNDKMGTFQAGRIYTQGGVSAGKFDPEGAAFYGPVNRITTGLALSIDAAQNANARVNNSIAWLSPNWSGFTAQVQYAFGENGEATGRGASTAATVATGNGGQDARMWGMGVDYTNGPLAVAFAYNDWNDFSGTTKGGVGRDLTEWFIGASYDFGMVKVTGSYQDFDMDKMVASGGQAVMSATNLGGANGLSSEGDIWSVGVIVPVMKVGSIRVSYASLDRDIRNGVGLRSFSADADGWGISYQHALSKRTTAYIGYTTLDNDRYNGTAANPALGIGGAAVPTNGNDSRGYAMGMRHTF